MAQEAVAGVGARLCRASRALDALWDARNPIILAEGSFQGGREDQSQRHHPARLPSVAAISFGGLGAVHRAYPPPYALVRSSATASAQLLFGRLALRGHALGDRRLQGMMTPRQSRAGWLEWSQDELGRRANVSGATVRSFERGQKSPLSNNFEAMRWAFEAAGTSLQFDQDGNASGITWSRRSTDRSDELGERIDRG
jgi:hypothetical protein